MSGDVWLGLARPGGVGSWFGTGLPDLPVKGGPTAIRVTDDRVTLEMLLQIPAARHQSDNVNPLQIRNRCAKKGGSRGARVREIWPPSSRPVAASAESSFSRASRALSVRAPSVIHRVSAGCAAGRRFTLGSTYLLESMRSAVRRSLPIR